MQRKALMDLASSAAFVPHIYDYCDQCCQECPGSPRCLLYHADEADTVNEAAGAPLSGEEFARAVADATGTAAAALDLILCDPSAPPDAAALADPLHVLGNHYAVLLAGFLRSVDLAMGEEPNDVEADALTTVAWFQMIIPMKTYRALISARRTGSGTPELYEDALGCAKLVLLGVQRSRAALEAIAHLYVRAGALIELLDAIRDGLERRFPGAWRFTRPGLDA